MLGGATNTEGTESESLFHLPLAFLDALVPCCLSGRSRPRSDPNHPAGGEATRESADWLGGRFFGRFRHVHGRFRATGLLRGALRLKKVQAGFAQQRGS